MDVVEPTEMGSRAGRFNLTVLAFPFSETTWGNGQLQGVEEGATAPNLPGSQQRVLKLTRAAQQYLIRHRERSAREDG